MEIQIIKDFIKAMCVFTGFPIDVLIWFWIVEDIDDRSTSILYRIFAGLWIALHIIGVIWLVMWAWN